MEFWIVIGCAVILVLSYTNLRSFYKHIIMARKIRELCKKKGFKLVPTHFFWMMGRRNGNFCDFYIESYDSVYSVKLFSVPNRKNILIFTDDDKYILRKLIAVRFSIYYSDCKPRELKKYNFRKKFKNEWELKHQYNILLVNPVCHEIRKRTRNGVESLVGAGDLVNRMEVYPLSRFIGRLNLEQRIENISTGFDFFEEA